MSRGAAKFQVSCTVDASTDRRSFSHCCKSQRTGAQIDLAQVRKSAQASRAPPPTASTSLASTATTSRASTSTATTVTVGGVKVNLAGVAHRIVNGKALEVFGFTVKDGVLVTPSGQSIKFDSSDVLDFLENAVAVVQQGRLDHDLRATAARSRSRTAR
jgi:hypothetical protein